MRTWIRPLLLVCLSLAFAELLLHILAAISPTVDQALLPPWERTASIEDRRLGLKGNPLWPGHDRWGFRNEAVPKEVDIVALGDSHTYGTSVERDEAWPAQLGVLSGQTVYNMGLGGYGAAHHLLNLDQALRLNPKVVIFAFYFGNDLYDAFTLALSNDTIGAYLPDDLVEIIERLEATDPLGPKAMRLYNRGEEHQSARFSLHRFVSTHGKLYGVVRALKNSVSPPPQESLVSKDFDRAVARIDPRQKEFVSVHEGAQWRTLLTAPYRSLVVDDSDPRIRGGVAVTKSVLAEMAEQATGAGASFLVVLLPTKESVFYAKIGDSTQHPGLTELAEDEARIGQELTMTLDELGLPVLDLVDHLRHAQAQPYFEDADGHPNRLGHEVIARAIMEQIEAPPVR